MTIGMPLLTAFLFMSFGFNYYYVNTKNTIESSNMYVDESSQIELAATGMNLAKETLFNDIGWNNCLGAEKNCKEVDANNFYKLYSSTLQKDLDELPLNRGKINVYAKNISNQEIMVVSEGIEGEQKKYIGSIFTLSNALSSDFIPTMYTFNGSLVASGNISLCTYKLNTDGSVEGQINTNTTLYWGDNSFNKYSVTAPSIANNVDPSIDRNVKVISDKANFNICAPGGDEIYGTGNVNLTKGCSNGYSVNKVWANGDVTFSSGVTADEVKANGDYVTYPDFKNIFDDYVYDSSNYGGPAYNTTVIPAFDFSNHPYYTVGFTNTVFIPNNPDILSMIPTLNNIVFAVDESNVDTDYTLSSSSSNLYFNNSSSQAVDIYGLSSPSCISPSNPYIGINAIYWNYGYNYTGSNYVTYCNDLTYFPTLRNKCKEGYTDKKTYYTCMSSGTTPTSINYNGSVELFNGDDIINLKGNLGGTFSVASGYNQIDIDGSIYSSATITFGSGNDELRIGSNTDKLIDVKSGNNTVNINGYSVGISSSVSGGIDKINVGTNVNGNVNFEKGGSIMYIGGNLNGNFSLKPDTGDENYLYVGGNISGTIDFTNSGSILASNDVIDVKGNVYNNILTGYGNDSIYVYNSTAGIKTFGNTGETKNIYVDTGMSFIETSGSSDDNIIIGGSITGAGSSSGKSLELGYGTDSVYVVGNVGSIKTLSGTNRIVVNGNVYSSVDIGTTDNGNSEFLVKGSVGSWGGSLNFYGGDDKIYIKGTVSGSINLGSGDDQIILGGTVSSVVDGSSGTDAILLLGYSRTDWDNNLNNIQNNVRNFEYISFGSGTNLNNGQDVNNGTQPTDIVCSDGQTVDLQPGVYKSLTIIGSCVLNLTGNEYYFDTVTADDGPFNRTSTINYGTDISFNAGTVDVVNGNVLFSQEANTNGQFIMNATNININNSTFVCDKPLTCLFNANLGQFTNNVTSQGSFIFYDTFNYDGSNSTLFNHIGSVISENMKVQSNVRVCNLYDSNTGSLNSNVNWFDISQSGTGPIPSVATQKLKVICDSVQDCFNKMTIINNY